ncbi:LysM peptidoglycan-binding domain-containing protein [Micromonospora sp. CPCC 206060]|uniref:CIS tube protein n=1 Tax=Micromonospora sp. CPCC 206060 TaxID=3122406 RepID=UPI002FF347EB
MSASPVTFSAAGSSGGQQGGAPPQLTHAYLQLHEPPRNGGTASPGPQLHRIPFQFNPKELALTKTAKWKRDAQRNAKKSGVPEFTGADPAKLTVEMFFDATDTMDSSVVKRVEELFACCVPTEASRQQKKGSPPWVVFHWGGMVGFPSFVASVNAKYTLFTPGGTPIRALCTVTLEEISGEQSGQNPTSGALAARDVHVVVAGDTLHSIAYAAYGRAGLWRVIAEANEIDDPLRLRPGRALLVPAPEELSTLVGPHGQ